MNNYFETEVHWRRCRGRHGRPDDRMHANSGTLQHGSETLAALSAAAAARAMHSYREFFHCQRVTSFPENQHWLANPFSNTMTNLLHLRTSHAFAVRTQPDFKKIEMKPKEIKTRDASVSGRDQSSRCDSNKIKRYLGQNCE
jgi:hypothetical protein